MTRIWSAISTAAALGAVALAAKEPLASMDGGGMGGGFEDVQKPLLGDDSRGGDSNGSGSRGAPNPLDGEFGEFVRGQMKEWHVPGLSIAVVDGEDVFAEGYGFATLPDVPATPETLWYGASTTKSQTAALLSHLIDSRNYSSLAEGWSTTISSVIRDDFVVQDEWSTSHLTLEDAVSHRTGLPRHDKSWLREAGGRQLKARDIVRNLRNLPITEKPRTKFLYNNAMYVTLAHVMETVTGQWLGDLFREHVWGPLGMDSTYLSLREALDAPGHLASGYYWDQKGGRFEEVPHMTVDEISGAGGAISNVLDYAKWVKCLLQQAEPFSAAVHQDIRAPRMLSRPAASDGFDIKLYGLGWERSTHNGRVVYNHGGGMHAYGAQIYWLPEHNYGVVAFANTAVISGFLQEIVCFRLIDEKLGIPEAERFDFYSKWKGAVAGLSGLADNPVKMLYPDLPDKTLPPSVSLSKLAGTYYNAGYGNITLQEESGWSFSKKRTLVGSRPEATWRYGVRVEHVSHDYWIIYLPMAPTAGLGIEEFIKGQFQYGTNGEVAGLETEWVNFIDNMYEGKVFFSKIA